MKNSTIGHIVIPLFKGVLYKDRQETIWHELLAQQYAVQAYLKPLGVTVIVDELEGYAFLQQCNDDELMALSPENPLPKLIVRRPLGYALSVLCLVIRKRLLEQDTEGGNVSVVITQQALIEKALIYLPSQENEAKQVDKIKSHIHKMIDLGLLRPLKNSMHTYEIRRIVKSMIDARWLHQLDQVLEEYRDHASGVSEDE